MKLANFPASMLPTLSYTPNQVAGVFVSASIAAFSDKPFSMAFLTLAKNDLASLKSALVKQKGMPAFSIAPGLVGASSQCFMSCNETSLASAGSSTSIATGKFKCTISGALVAATSLILWYSFPVALIMYCTPNSSPTRSARITPQTSPAPLSAGSKI